MSDNHQERYKKAADRFQEATGPKDYNAVLIELSSILQDSEYISPSLRRNCLLLSALSTQSLGDLPETEKILRNLLKDVENEPGDEGPGFIVNIHLTLAELFKNTNRREEAINYYTLTARYFNQIRDWKSEFNVYMTIAQLWQDLRKSDQVITSLDNARSVLEKQEDELFHQLAYFRLGHEYYVLGNVNDAIELEERALSLARQNKDAETESKLIYNLAELTFQNQDYRRALHYISNRLNNARSHNDRENINYYLSYLGACLTETGQSKKAFDIYDELEKRLSKQRKKKSVMFGMCLLGKAQVLVDMKKHQEAIPLLNRSLSILKKFNTDTTLLEILNNRIERETQGPYIIDCPHRILQMALTGSSQNLSHSNPQPTINTTVQFVSQELSNEEIGLFSELHKELTKDLYQTKYADSQIEGIPDSMIMPMKIEYVDDVEKFEFKWTAYKRELESIKKRSILHREWTNMKNKFTYSDGTIISSQSDKLELLEYLRLLTEITELFAELNDQDSVRKITLHAADFVEMQTSDPMICVMIWAIRAKLMFSAYLVSEPGCLDLLEIELWCCFNQIRILFNTLDQESRIATLDLNLKNFTTIANKILGRKGFEYILDLVGDLYDSLNQENKFYYGIALGESGYPEKAVKAIDNVIGKIRADGNGNLTLLAVEFQQVLASYRYRTMCPDYESAEWHYGPFSLYIHQEVQSRSPETYPNESEKGYVALSRPPVLAFIDNNLVVLDKRLQKTSYVSTLTHEMTHLSYRSGQKLLAETGKWLQVIRDVPTASALTYFYLLEDEKKGTKYEYTKKIHELVEAGHNQVEKNSEAAHRNINNMLQYFDDLYTRETYASYPCGAILLGMAYGFLGSEDEEIIVSYLNHLKVTDHRNALKFGRKKAKLRL